MGKVEESDRKEYSDLLKSSMAPGAMAKAKLQSNQQRKNVVKEIFWGRKEPLYLRVGCEESELIIVQSKGIRALEKMRGVKGLMQERLYYESVSQGIGGIAIGAPEEMQDVRYFEAEKGICNYNGKEFLGHNITMKKYALPGHEIPLFPFSTLAPLSCGQGKRLHAILKKKGLEVAVDRMQTSFKLKEGI